VFFFNFQNSGDSPSSFSCCWHIYSQQEVDISTIIICIACFKNIHTQVCVALKTSLSKGYDTCFVCKYSTVHHRMNVCEQERAMPLCLTNV